MKRSRIAILGLIGSLLPATGMAGSWTLEPGHWQLINTASYYHTSSYDDAQGTTHSQPGYTKLEYNPYLEYGLRDGLTVGASTFLQQVDQVSENSGLADTELFLRQRLWQQGDWVVSVQPLVKLPSWYTHDRLPKGGGDQMDAELGVSGGYSFTAFGQRHFADAGLAYRHRFESPDDQMKFSGTLGLRLNEKWMVMPQAFMTWRTDDSSGATAFTQSSADDYDLLKGQISVVYNLNERTNLQLGAFDHLYSRNTGNGGGVLFSVWLNY